MSGLSWPVPWWARPFCRHPSTSGLYVEGQDGRWTHEDVRCLRCGRLTP